MEGASRKSSLRSRRKNDPAPGRARKESTWNLAAAVSTPLSHGTVDPNIDPSNAVPNTGELVKVNGDGTFTVVADSLDRPTSLEFIGNTAYVVTLTGEIWKVDGVSCPPYGASH